MALFVLLPALAIASFAAPGKAGPLQSACQPDPLDPNPQVLECRYGPITVTPGSNLILAEPVKIEAPKADGYVTKFRPDMVNAVEGDIPRIDHVHLHHGVWLSPTRHGTTPFMAAGEEKTVFAAPDGYGYRVFPSDTWVLNYMIHNQTAATYEVFITYELTWQNASAATLKEVNPLWYDVVGGLYPVYDPEPSSTGEHVRTRSFSVPAHTEVVWMAGHVHPGGKRLEVDVSNCNGKSGDLFTSEVRSNERGGSVPPESFGSWDYLMTATPSDWRFTTGANGARLSISSIYDTSHPWYEAMGIVVAWGHTVSSDTPGCTLPAHTTGVVTREPPPDDSVFFGGPDQPDTTPPAQGSPVGEVAIAAFDYQPGGLAQPPAAVEAGSTVRFTNFDAGASIFHTVTSCAAPCNGPTGQSYPLPTWDFDSFQLGYGPPEATAASNRISFDLTVPPSAAPGTRFTYYCRVHPFMRGALEVVA